MYLHPPQVHPTRIHITCVQVKYQTSTGRTNLGVATTWLLGHKTSEHVPAEGEPPLPLDVRVPCFVRKSQFRWVVHGAAVQVLTRRCSASLCGICGLCFKPSPSNFRSI